ncbi:Cilia- and flagella-associated protein [Schistosoma japonicum]|nr:Cilia- and flagella-associated protein [Schistosoma japonicum]
MEKTDESFEIRRSNLTDVTQIEKLKNKVNLKGFGKKSLVKLIEKSVLSLCVTDNEKVIVGAACFYEYPNASQFPENDWIPRFSSTYCIQNVTYINSLFIHFLVISPAYEKLVTNQLLKAAFTIASFVHYIFVLLEDVHNIKCLNFSPFHKLPKGCADANDIFCAYRHEIFPVLYCRPAMVEDTDDITPILNDLSTHLRTTYGDYYIAELVEAQSDNLKCFVVEYDRRAVGFVSATRNLNLIKLNEYYDLDVFDGLVKNDKLIKDRSQQGDKFAATGAQNEAEVTDNIMDGNETTSTYAGNKEHIGLVDLNHSNYLSVNEITDQVYHHWTKRLLYKNHTVKDTSNIMLDVKKPNAFAIQLFIMKSEYESRYMDMLPLVFSQFTDLEYAVISVPRSVKCFPMLKSFVHCRIRLNKDPEHELYVLHRSELHRDFTVRRTRHADEEGIKLLIEKMNIFDRSLLLADLQAFIRNGRDEDGTIISSYVFVALNKIVGVAILRDEHDIEWLRAHYNIEDFIYFAHHGRNEHASLYHFMLAANFQSRTEIFLREILRQSKKTCIYYRVLPPYAPDSKFNRCTLITCLSRLCPVKPRKQIIYPESLINSVKAPEKRILEKFNTMSALFMTTGKLLMEPKEIINARIIVVGASTTGLAVLETLVTCPYIRFNNLVLLSSNDLPGDTLHPVNPLFYKFLPTDYAYPVDYLSQLGLKVCVNTIHGKLTAIDRKFKRITVSSGQKLSYDYLIITTGLQYHVANPIINLQNPNKENIITNVEHSNTSLPNNFFIINHVNDVLPIINWISNIYLPLYHKEQSYENDTCSTDIQNFNADKELNNENNQINEEKQFGQQQKQHRESNTEEELKSQSNQLLYDTFSDLDTLNDTVINNLIIIYGYTIDAYTCITGLLNAGVSGKCIIMIQPPEVEHYPPAFNSSVIRRHVHEYMKKLKIRIGYDLILDHWSNVNVELNSSYIKTVTFSSNGKYLTIPCSGLFYFYMKTVDMDVFRALNDSCLVFDSRLVIDINFHTNDTSIRAAGPITKFKRIYYNDYWRHEIANSVEIGHCLGDQLLDLFDPNIGKLKKPPTDNSLILPTFQQPKIIGALLPGNISYLHCVQPSSWELLENSMKDSDSGRLLVTGMNTKELRIFSIYINKYNLVQEITCLSEKVIEYGKKKLATYNYFTSPIQ